ncbi:sensor histidine kinase [Sediminibacillus massiliensis]|uniref:sensor histidine kinase n=1 Tax=Sediminibacillus massiliensis TaxID=1926277 RepID=UPI00098841F8|nr:sensor histidine kinase [Sediminibacillus massiliensis]
MIRKFLAERISWILLVLFLQLLALFMAYLDADLGFDSMLYYVFLSVVIFGVFAVFRYHRETKFYKELSERENNFDLDSLPEPDSPFEQLIDQSITHPIERLKVEAANSQQHLEQEKDELLSWIHEVKTPLTTMHLIIDRIGDSQLKAELVQEWLRIHLLLDQQLHRKRMPFIENDLYIEELDLESLLTREINMLRSWCMKKGIGIDVGLPVRTVLSDAKWLAFIIRQLLTNAVKYSVYASEIQIKSGWQNGQTFLQVKDFGRGIKSKDLPRIFDKGFTSTSQHEDNTATGMGLYLAKTAAIPLQIEICADSTYGSGTTITLSFPEKNTFVDIRGM